MTGHHPRRQRRGQDQSYEPICMHLPSYGCKDIKIPTPSRSTRNSAQATRPPSERTFLQRRSWWMIASLLCRSVRLPLLAHVGNVGAALGHCRSGAIPVSGGSLLPRRGLLRPRLRRQQLEELRYTRQLEGRVPHSSEPSGPRKLSICMCPSTHTSPEAD